MCRLIWSLLPPLLLLVRASVTARQCSASNSNMLQTNRRGLVAKVCENHEELFVHPTKLLHVVPLCGLGVLKLARQATHSHTQSLTHTHTASASKQVLVQSSDATRLALAAGTDDAASVDGIANASSAELRLSLFINVVPCERVNACLCRHLAFTHFDFAVVVARFLLLTAATGSDSATPAPLASSNARFAAYAVGVARGLASARATSEAHRLYLHTYKQRYSHAQL